MATAALAARGDHKAFRRFYEHYAPFVWRAAYRMAGANGQHAEQITQDVFVRAHRGLHSFDSRSALSTWLYRITYNQGMTYLSRLQRWQKRTTEMPDSLSSPSGLSRLEAREIADRLLKKLTPEERFLLVAREVEGISFDELAETTGKSSGSLRTQVSRIKSMLREEAVDETD